MKKIKTTLLLLTISLLSISGFGQTQEFTDEAAFLAALGGATMTLEDYENCPTINGFTLSTPAPLGCVQTNICGGTGLTFGFENQATFNFDATKNAFGTFIVGAGNNDGPIDITLMTDDNQSYNVVQNFSSSDPCNRIFFGIISDMNFTMAIFTNSNSDGMGFDNTYCANTLAPIPTLSQWGIIALSMIMLIIGLVFMKQRKVIFG